MLLLNAFRIPFEMKDEVLPFGSQRLLVLMVVDKNFIYIIHKKISLLLLLLLLVYNLLGAYSFRFTDYV